MIDILEIERGIWVLEEEGQNVLLKDCQGSSKPGDKPGSQTMEKISKKHRKISIADALGLDPGDPADNRWLQFRDLLVGLLRVMVDKGVSKNELARRMKISRQAVYEKFSGKNTSMEWIQRACQALGVEIRVSYIDKKKAA